MVIGWSSASSMNFYNDSAATLRGRLSMPIGVGGARDKGSLGKISAQTCSLAKLAAGHRLGDTHQFDCRANSSENFAQHIAHCDPRRLGIATFYRLEHS